MDLGISGKRALVLGASRGLGKAIAQALAREGADVTAASRSVGKIEAWAGELAGQAPHIPRAAAVDLSDLASVDALADKVLSEGGVEILVLNSGGPPPGPALGQERGAWLGQFETMAANLFHLAGRLLPGMQQRGWGRIVIVGSSGVEQPIPNLALSNGVRAAVAGWAKTLASEVAADGVTVNMVLPGRVATERVDELDAANAERQGKPIDDVRKAARANIPVGRYGKPEEFGAVVAFLCGSQAAYVTGSKVRVDGGQTKGV